VTIGLLGLLSFCLLGAAYVISLLIPFFDDTKEGFLCFFVPFYHVYYMSSHRDTMGAPVLPAVAGVLLAGLGYATGMTFLDNPAKLKLNVPAAAAAGAADDREYEGLVAQEVETYYEMKDVLVKVRSAADAETVAEQYTTLARRFSQLQKQTKDKIRDPWKVPAAQITRLHGDDYKHAQTSYLFEAQRVAKLDGVTDILKLDRYDWQRMFLPRTPAPDLAHGAGEPVAGPRRAPPAADVPTPGRLDAAWKPPVDDAFVAKVLEDLRSPEKRLRSGALLRLGANQPGGCARRAEVARAVEPLLADPDAVTRSSAAFALSWWGDSESVPALLVALKDPGPRVRESALTALVRIPDPRAAPALAECLVGFRSGQAIEGLKKIGPAAEPAVIPYLESDDFFARASACKVLQVIGTSRSVPALRTIAQNSGPASRDARLALQQIGAREGKPVTDNLPPARGQRRIAPPRFQGPFGPRNP
jgi:hypothetical protein